MMQQNYTPQVEDTISIETDTHVIEVSEGCLTIGTHAFPGDCVSLSPQEADLTLQLLLQWKLGASFDQARLQPHPSSVLYS